MVARKNIRKEKFYQLPQFYLGAILTLTLYTFLYAANFPSLWVANQILWSYEFGFVKRGLVGTILSLFFDFYSYTKIAYLCFAILFLEIGMLIWFCYLVIKKVGVKIAPVILIFFISNSLAFHIAMVGYLDNLLIVFAVGISLISLNSQRSVYYISALTIAGLLTHEIFVFIAAPVVIVKLALLLTEKNVKKNVRKAVLINAGIPLGIMLVFTLIIMFTDWLILSAAARIAMAAELGKVVDYRMLPNNFNVLNRTFMANFMLSTIYLGDNWFLAFIKVASRNLAFLPVTIFYIVLGFSAFMNSPKRRHGVAVNGLALAL